MNYFINIIRFLVMTFYDILGVSKDADENELRKAYRKLSMEWHPDRNPAPEANAKFQEINEAYETLSNANKRREYDMQQQFGGGGAGGFPFGGMGGGDPFGDIFEMMFQGAGGGFPGGGIHIVHNGIPMNFGGGGMPFGPGGQFHFRHVPRKPEPIVKTINISLEQSFAGCKIPVEIERNVIQENARHNEVEHFMIDIPAGIDTNDNLVMNEKGHIHHGMRGDVKLVIQIDNNTAFQRHGIDLHYKKRISLKDALCGFNFEIKHLNGSEISISNNQKVAIIRPGDKKVLPNYGMKKGDKTGNLIIEFEVDFPAHLSEDQTRFLSEILTE